MQQVSVREAETQLAKLIEQASHGDDILIVEGGVPGRSGVRSHIEHPAGLVYGLL